MHVPIEFGAIDLTIAADVLEVLGRDQHGSEVSPQGGIRAVGRKHCKVCHDASAQVKAGGSLERALELPAQDESFSGQHTSRSTATETAGHKYHWARKEKVPPGHRGF